MENRYLKHTLDATKKKQLTNWNKLSVLVGHTCMKNYRGPKKEQKN